MSLFPTFPDFVVNVAYGKATQQLVFGITEQLVFLHRNLDLKLSDRVGNKNEI